MEEGVESVSAALKEILAGYPEIRLGILYGSVATGTARPDSDVDVAVAKHHRHPLDDETLIDISLSCSRSLGREVHVRDLSRAQGVFLKEVLTKGTVVYQTDTVTRAELIIRMLDFVEDMLPTVRMIRRKNRERFLAGE
jgi:predicted nucleotidyltransferase